MPFTPGTYDVVVEFEMDYSGQQSYTGFWIDGQLLGETNDSNGIDGGASNDGEANLTFGTYMEPAFWANKPDDESGPITNPAVISFSDVVLKSE